MSQWRSFLGVCFFFLLVGIFPVRAQSSITHVQSVLSSSATYVSSQSAVFTSTVSSGNLVVIAVSSYAPLDADITAVQDSKGNIYKKAVQNPVIAKGHHHISIWYAENVIGGGSFTVTAVPVANAYVTLAAHEYTHASIESVLDKVAQNNGSTVTATSSNTDKTVQDNELIFGAFMHESASNPTMAVAPDFTLRQSMTDGNSESLVTEDKTATASGFYSAQLDWGTALSWRGVAATFKAITGISLTPTPQNVISLTPSATPSVVTPTQTVQDLTNTGSITVSNTTLIARTKEAFSKAALKTTFSDPAAAHTENERNGTFTWQHTKVYIPSKTLNQLSGNEYITVGGMYSSAGAHEWYVKVNEGGRLTAVGSRYDGTPIEFDMHGTVPTDQWVDLELGLHTQNGAGVKRAFAVVMNGHFYGWYRQGRMDTEAYDSSAFGILDTNSADQLEVFLENPQTITHDEFPSGPDLRSTAALQNHSFLDGRGENVQLDWSTWQNDIKISTEAGIFSNSDRVQTGINTDRMPDLTNGWAEIEIGLNGSAPPANPSSYFGPMISFHKEINREENLEIVPIGNGDGTVDLVFEAWTNGSPTVLARKPLPMPEQGDILRAKWQMVRPDTIHVQASYYDASTKQWFSNMIDGEFNIVNLGGINLNDSFHKASTITIDTTYYSIRRYQLGTVDTYPSQNIPPSVTPIASASATVVPTAILPVTPTQTPSPSITITPSPSPTPSLAPAQTIILRINSPNDDVNQDGTLLSTDSSWIGTASSVSSSYTGLRFNSVNIPQHATITSAQLKVYSIKSQWLALNVSIAAEATANSGPFVPENLLSTRTLTTASVNHSSNTSWSENTWYTIEDIKPVLQEIVNRGDWSSGNSFSLIMKGTNTDSWGRKFFEKYESSPANAPQLVVTYQ